MRRHGKKDGETGTSHLECSSPGIESAALSKLLGGQFVFPVALLLLKAFSQEATFLGPSTWVETNAITGTKLCSVLSC